MILVKDDPIGLSFVLYKNFANKAIASGKVDLYSTMGTKSGLITVGDASGCVVMVNGKLKCWGQNDNSQLGRRINYKIGLLLFGQIPNSISTADIIVAVVSGRSSTCAYFYSGLKCWGKSNAGF